MSQFSANVSQIDSQAGNLSSVADQETESPGVPSGADSGRRPFTIGLTAASSIGLSPRWVQYSGVSATACKTAEALTDLATMSTRGDQRPALDREFVAYLAGLTRADKLPPFLQELQEIGFLSIFDGGADPDTGRRRQRRAKDGRPVFDHFEITLEPPAAYVGPRNLTEVHAQFIADRDAAYRDAEAANKKPRVGRQTIRRTEVGYVDASQVNPVTGSRGQGSGTVTEIRGQQEFSQVNPVTGSRGQGSGTVTEIRGQQEFSQVNPVTGIRGPVLDLIESSPRRRGEDSIEPVPGGAAKPPATGKDEQLRAAVTTLVARLPWREWAKKAKREFVPTQEDAEQVQTAILDALMTGRITLDQATEIACAALRKATGNPVWYVSEAFSAKNLGRWARTIQPAQLSDDPLPLDPTPSGAAVTPADHDVANEDTANAAPDRPKCHLCGAEEGAGPGDRMRRGEDGRMRHCDCRPASIAPKASR